MRLFLATRYRFSYQTKYKYPLEQYYKKNALLPGWCTSHFSQIYSQRNKAVHPQHWRHPKGIDQKLSISSLGMGTYNG